MSEQSRQISLQDFQNISDAENDKNNESQDSQDIWKIVNRQLNPPNKKETDKLPISHTQAIQQEKALANLFSKEVPQENPADPFAERIKAIRSQQQFFQSQQSPSLLDDFITDCKNKIQPQKTQRLVSDDEFAGNEYLEYLQFKEQLHVKRLMEVRQMHQDFTKSIVQYEQPLQQAIKQILEKAIKQSDEILNSQENEIRIQLKNIQHELIEFKHQSGQRNIVHSAVKALPNKYQPILDQIDQVLIELGKWPTSAGLLTPSTRLFDTVEISKNSSKKMYLSSKITPQKKSSPPKRILKHESPKSFIRQNNFNQLEEMIKELQKNKQKIESPLSLKLSGYLNQKTMGLKQTSLVQIERGRSKQQQQIQSNTWGEILRRTSQYQSRSRSRGELRSDSNLKFSDVMQGRKANFMDRVGLALKEQQQKYYGLM